MGIAQWPARWEALDAACQAHDATGRWLEGRTQAPAFQIAPPASREDIAEVEGNLGIVLPDSFKRVLTSYSAHACIEWQFPENVRPPQQLKVIFSGECRWDVSALPDLYDSYLQWVDKCFSNPDDPYDAVWHNKLPFLEVGNGDMVAIELGLPDQQPVVYLSHDDGEGHGYWLGSDFEDYIDRLSLLGCPGAEDWQWMPFVSDPHSLLQPFGEAAEQWRTWFQLRLPEE